jgi:hypothetical protein
MLENGHGQTITKMHVLIKSQNYLFYIEIYIINHKTSYEEPFVLSSLIECT